jgi:hypothetical protein
MSVDYPAHDQPVVDRVDHLVYAAPDLEAAVTALAATFGVRASAGGQHPGFGTRNALLQLGPRSYLEIVAPDPQQPEPATPRWFGIDTLTEPRLVTWAAHGEALVTLRELSMRAGVPLGDVRRGQRVRADGVPLSWELTSPFAMLADGLVPFFIDWGNSPHPAQTAAAGLTLRSLRAEHPQPDAVNRLNAILKLALRVDRAERASLIAVIDGPLGRRELR